MSQDVICIHDNVLLISEFPAEGIDDNGKNLYGFSCFGQLPKQSLMFVSSLKYKCGL
jgi:hypothetical protein